MRRFKSLSEFSQHQGTEIGVSDWLTITQDRIDRFAAATEDHQWIHVDPERTRSQLDMDPIAHGYLTLSLVPKFIHEIFTIESVTRAINYGANKIRFTNAVPVQSRLRGRLSLLKAVVGDGAMRAISSVTIEIDGASRPALVAETITLFYE
ncbi:MAG: MaoC family dehydratase [Hyphomicrobiales bacterium]